ncbi:MAG TPA: glycoside hydrolase family 15 protein, partial [Nitrosomonas sp.]|nr:glycoside hydrolase family 15 protein [Nitrosomonas sp.]
GGERNWDYRFTWIRDAAFTMYSFLRLGYTDEARKFLAWIQQRSLEIDTADALKLMYRIDGSTDLEEANIPHLQGYQDSTPVRVGNDAFNQFQLDIYGELIDTIYLYNKNAEPISYDFWLSLIKFIDFVCKNWQKKGRGMWEVRDEEREFLISKVMSWVALDRGIKIAEDRAFPAPLERWRQTRDDIFNDVFNNYWNSELEAFVQYRGADTLDASALLIPLVRMLSPKEPRWISTLRAIEKELVTDSLVYRYKLGEGASDGLSDDEGTFSMCSFWYIECLAKSGELEKAVLYFEKMLGYANHLGLYSEQISLNGEQLGNFPQAFTHLGLISAAHQLRMLLAQDNIAQTNSN